MLKKLFKVGNNGILGMLKSVWRNHNSSAKSFVNFFSSTEWKNAPTLKKPWLAVKKGLSYAGNLAYAVGASVSLVTAGAVTAGIFQGTLDLWRGIASLLIIEPGFLLYHMLKGDLSTWQKTQQFKEAALLALKGGAKLITGLGIVAAITAIGYASAGTPFAVAGSAILANVIPVIGTIFTSPMLGTYLATVGGLDMFIQFTNRLNAVKSSSVTAAKDADKTISVTTPATKSASSTSSTRSVSATLPSPTIKIRGDTSTRTGLGTINVTRTDEENKSSPPTSLRSSKGPQL